MLVFIGIVWNSYNEITGTSFKREQKLPHELVSKKDLLSHPWAEESSKDLENISCKKTVSYCSKFSPIPIFLKNSFPWKESEIFDPVILSVNSS